MGANFLGNILMVVRNELRRDPTYSEFLNTQLEVMVDYTPLPQSQPQPAAENTVTYDEQEQLIPVAKIIKDNKHA